MRRVVIAGLAAALASTTAHAERPHGGPVLGALVPRRDLDAAPLVGAFATVRLDHAGMWEVGASFDWARTGRLGSAELTPSPFPRSRGELDETVDLATISASGGARLARFGSTELRVRLSAGMQIQRTHFTAYAMDAADTSVGPAGTLGLALEGRASATFTWSACAGWRESYRPLGTSETYATKTTSGALVLAGVAF